MNELLKKNLRKKHYWIRGSIIGFLISLIVIVYYLFCYGNSRGICGFKEFVTLSYIFGDNTIVLLVSYIIVGGIIGYLFDKFKNEN